MDLVMGAYFRQRFCKRKKKKGKTWSAPKCMINIKFLFVHVVDNNDDGGGDEDGVCIYFTFHFVVLMPKIVMKLSLVRSSP